MQKRPLKFSPVTGTKLLSPRVASEYIGVTWKYNPWTGTARAKEDMESDPGGIAILPPGEDVAAARQALHDDAEAHPLEAILDAQRERHSQGLPVSQGEHPLQAVFAAAIEQATKGKGVRHGGEATPFLEQPWVHYGKMHGRGFLTGQAAKKLEEAASTRKGEAFIAEALGALVYIGMAILKEREDEKL